ncbi:MAG: hypothetical protein K2Y18_07520 [Alphaproteobacteria bacterium]|jgi:hypothetical protein|nr:hypothetical protein [Alphaproteobacteria bacterium]
MKNFNTIRNLSMGILATLVLQGASFAASMLPSDNPETAPKDGEKMMMGSHEGMGMDMMSPGDMKDHHKMMKEHHEQMMKDTPEDMKEHHKVMMEHHEKMMNMSPEEMKAQHEKMMNMSPEERMDHRKMIMGEKSASAAPADTKASVEPKPAEEPTAVAESIK